MGEWFAIDAPRGVRAAGGESVRPCAGRPAGQGQRRGILKTLGSGGAAEGVRGSDGVADAVTDAARATRQLRRRRVRPAGLYHCVNSGAGTWLELAQYAAQQLGVAAQFEVVKFADVKLPAPRPQYCALSNAKLASVGIAMPPWREALAGLRQLVASH